MSLFSYVTNTFIFININRKNVHVNLVQEQKKHQIKETQMDILCPKLLTLRLSQENLKNYVCQEITEEIVKQQQIY